MFFHQCFQYFDFLCQVQDEVQKNKQEYSRCVMRLTTDEARYNDLKSKGQYQGHPVKVISSSSRLG